MIETQIHHAEEGIHEKKQDFDLVDLGEHDDNKDTGTVINENDALIREFQINLERSKCIISYYEQENEQLQAKHDIMEIHLIKEKREVMKAKALFDEAYDMYGEPEEEQ